MSNTWEWLENAIKLRNRITVVLLVSFNSTWLACFVLMNLFFNNCFLCEVAVLMHCWPYRKNNGISNGDRWKKEGCLNTLRETYDAHFQVYNFFQLYYFGWLLGKMLHVLMLKKASFFSDCPALYSPSVWNAPVSFVPSLLWLVCSHKHH